MIHQVTTITCSCGDVHRYWHECTYIYPGGYLSTSPEEEKR